jgi:hypothetical protein
MRLKTIYILLALLLIPTLTLSARDKKKQNLIIETCVDSIPDIVLDTINVNKKTFINDYSMIGVQYGAGLSQVMWNPSQRQEMILMPYNFGVTFTRYGKMFGYMPYFGFQVGVFYGQEGYQFKKNEDTGYTYTIQGADKAIMDVIEVPVLSHMHIDFWKMKVMADIGFYVGYRLNIHRFPFNGEYKNDAYAEMQNSFLETDNRLDYGIKGGVGFGFIFDPVEIHIKAAYKHALSSLYEPDHYSKYYYRYAYPSNIIVSVGLHFHLTKRTGRTKAELKKEAKELVYGTESFNSIYQK